MAGCCSTSRSGGGSEVVLPDGTKKTYATRAEALAAIAAAGGGIIRG